MSSGPQSPNQAIDIVGPITVTHVVLMAALALAAILAIWWGTVLRRRRAEAEQQMEEDFTVAEEHGATTPATVQGMDESPTGNAPAPAPAIPAPAPVAAPEALPVANDLTTIKGLGPKLATTLGEHGITSVAQIAALTPQAAAELDAKLGAFKGRMERDRWIEQAKLLSAGDRAAYEAAFGKLGG
ncbi:MAG: helix-hairpin-helix domain-containing protein [Sphingomonas sp.]|jgi:predicted flap endonuclease-1-like 5' DNA nuclease|uniref:helix-hairpin-helix domain-containing protein n=1 Tax=Sphingomonas sp. TaxID=28214 RepID=UPI003565D669